MTLGQTHRNIGFFFQRMVVGVLLVLLPSTFAPVNSGQTHHVGPAAKIESKLSTDNSVESAIRTICADRFRDPLASVPIDEMAMAQPLSVTDRRVVAGKLRAQALLPVARRLVPFALMRVAAANDLEPLSLRWIISRVRAVDTIKAEVDERDNASWRPSEPHAIIFGTVFLAGLRSDEAMIAVLGHELTHAMNGADLGLQPVFARIGINSSRLGDPVGAAAAIELGCEIVGIEVLRDYVSQTGKRGTTSRRFARALQKDCVNNDLADESHLSPRDTMRLLLKMKPEVANAVVALKERVPQKPKSVKVAKAKNIRHQDPRIHSSRRNTRRDRRKPVSTVTSPQAGHG